MEQTSTKNYFLFNWNSDLSACSVFDLEILFPNVSYKASKSMCRL